MSENEKLAMRLAAAIRKIARDDHFDALNNFENYLGHHFDKWMKHLSDSPENLVSEFEWFADMFD